MSMSKFESFLQFEILMPRSKKQIVECVYDLQHMGQMGQLRDRTYSEPRKWMREKGRVTIQFSVIKPQ